MTILQHRTRTAAKRAFTLIEIMVATVIMIVLVGLVIQITSEVLKVWTRSSGKLSANAEARIAMDLITQDLETAVFRNNGQQWLRVEGPEATGGQYDDDTVSLKLFSPALDRPQKYTANDTIPAGYSVGDDIPGDICAIGYRLAYKNSYASGPDVYALYRVVVDPKNTFDFYLGTGNAADSDQGSLESPGKGNANWSNTFIEADENYLVSNIVEFKVFVYLDDGLDEPVNVTSGTLNLSGDYAYGGTDGSTTPLLYADVMLTVVSDEGLEMLNNLGRIPESAADIVQQHGETFTRRVNFMAHPL